MFFAHSWVRFWVLCASLFFGIAGPRFAQAARNYTPHTGYLATTDGEREAKVQDMIIVQPPGDTGPTLRERIFNDKLSKEFRDRYEEKFGRTEAERVYHSPNRFNYYNDPYGLKGTDEEIHEERRKFGEFMVRRLGEYHVDNYMKNDPKARPVWEMKERLSNVNVQVREFRFDINYSLSGNTLDVKVVNPYLEVARVRLEMNPGSFGPGSPDEMIVTAGRPVTKTTRIDTHYKVYDRVLQIVGQKSLSPVWGTSFTHSTYTSEHGKTRRETLYLAGMTYVF